MPKKSKRTPRKKYLVIGLATVVVLIAAGVTYFALSGDDADSPTTITTADGQQVNIKPPTTQEQQVGNDQKSQIVQRDQQLSNTSTTGPKTVSVVITEANSSGVKGYVPGVFEDGGTCSASATQGSATVTGQSTGFENVSYTQCSPITWSSALGSGSWSVTLTYKSATAGGSQTVAIKV